MCRSSSSTRGSTRGRRPTRCSARSPTRRTAMREMGIVGLGRMGGGLALQAMEKGVRVVGFTLGGARRELTEAGLVEARTLASLRESLAERPRAVFLYVPAGPPVDALLDELAGVLESGDIVVDGGNSYWGDSVRRAERLRARGL